MVIGIGFKMVVQHRKPSVHFYFCVKTGGVIPDPTVRYFDSQRLAKARDCKKMCCYARIRRNRNRRFGSLFDTRRAAAELACMLPP